MFIECVITIGQCGSSLSVQSHLPPALGPGLSLLLPHPKFPGPDLCSQHLREVQGGEPGPPSPTDLQARGPCRGHRVSILQPHQCGAGGTGGIAGQPDRGVDQHGAWQAGWQRDSRGHCSAGVTWGTG